MSRRVLPAIKTPGRGSPPPLRGMAVVPEPAAEQSKPSVRFATGGEPPASLGNEDAKAEAASPNPVADMMRRAEAAVVPRTGGSMDELKASGMAVRSATPAGSDDASDSSVGAPTAWSASGRMLVAFTSSVAGINGDLVTLESDEELFKEGTFWCTKFPRRELEGHTGTVRCVAWAPHGTQLATGSDDNTVIIWHAASGDKDSVLRGHSGDVRAVAWSNSGLRIASGSADNTAIVWNSGDGKALFALKGHSGDVTSVAWSKSGAQVATGSMDKTVRVWNAATGEVRLNLDLHGDAVLGVDWSPNGEWIASASEDETVRVWNAMDGTSTLELKGHKSDVCCVRWDPTSTQLITCAVDDDVVRMWDATTGEAGIELHGHADDANVASFCPDGTQVASCSEDGTVRVWDPEKGDTILVLRGYSDEVNAVAWSPSGTQLAAVSGRTVDITSPGVLTVCCIGNGPREPHDGAEVAAWWGQVREDLKGHSVLPWLAHLKLGPPQEDGEEDSMRSSGRVGGSDVRAYSLITLLARGGDAAAVEDLLGALLGTWKNEIDIDGDFDVHPELMRHAATAMHGDASRSIAERMPPVAAWFWQELRHMVTRLAREGHESQGKELWEAWRSEVAACLMRLNTTHSTATVARAQRNLHDATGGAVPYNAGSYVLTKRVGMDALSAGVLPDAPILFYAHAHDTVRLKQLLMTHVLPRLHNPDGVDMHALVAQAGPGRRSVRAAASKARAPRQPKKTTRRANVREWLHEDPAWRDDWAPAANSVCTVLFGGNGIPEAKSISAHEPDVVRWLLHQLRFHGPLRHENVPASWAFAHGTGVLRRSFRCHDPIDLERDAEDGHRGTDGVLWRPRKPTGADKVDLQQRPAEAFVTPLPLCGVESLLRFLLQHGTDRTFSNPVIVSVLHAKWAAYGKAWYLRQTVFYMALLLVFSFASVLLQQQPIAHDPDEIERHTRLVDIVVIVMLVLVARQLLNEVNQVRMGAKRIGMEAKSMGLSPKDAGRRLVLLWKASVEHLTDVWNLVDVAGVGSCAAFGALHLSRGADNASRALLVSSCALPMMWAKSLFFMRGYQSTGPFVRIVIAICNDMLKVLLILVVTGIGYALAFYTNFPPDAVYEKGGPEASGDELKDYRHLGSAMFTVLRMSLGDFDVSSFEFSASPTISVVLFVSLMVLVPIVLLNLLIALMGDTFERVSVNLQAQWMRERATLLLEVETMEGSIPGWRYIARGLAAVLLVVAVLFPLGPLWLLRVCMALTCCGKVPHIFDKSNLIVRVTLGCIAGLLGMHDDGSHMSMVEASFAQPWVHELRVARGRYSDGDEDGDGIEDADEDDDSDDEENAAWNARLILLRDELAEETRAAADAAADATKAQVDLKVDAVRADVGAMTEKLARVEALLEQLTGGARAGKAAAAGNSAAAATRPAASAPRPPAGAKPGYHPKHRPIGADDDDDDW